MQQHWAAKRRYFGTVRVLKDAGCKSTIEAIEGWTPHSVAIFHQKKLLESKLASDQDINPSVPATESTDNERNVIPGMSYSDPFPHLTVNRIFAVHVTIARNIQILTTAFKCKASSSETHADHRFDKGHKLE
ncbi:hypothetical protein MMC29_007894 [Sticta canariensis]|nr:hypothetical protein [Sticta canariensis]